MSSNHDEDLQEQARAWIVRLASGEMSAQDLSAFKSWRSRSEQHETAFERERAFWQRLSRLEPAFERLEQTETSRSTVDTEQTGTPVPASTPFRAPGRVHASARLFRARTKMRPRYRTLPFVALAACLLLALFNTDLSTFLLADYTSDDGTTSVLTLPDGSRATLNRNSAIRLLFDDSQRQVEILKGEAYFEVRRDRQRPFRVLAEGTVSEALGTAYAVRGIEGGARVAVTKGHVGVTVRGQPQTAVHLLAGEGIRYNGTDGSVRRFTLNVEHTLAWRRDRVVFDERPLRDALKELEYYHRGRILLLGNGRFQSVSGTVDLKRLDDGIAALAATHGLEVFEVTPYLTLLR